MASPTSTNDAAGEWQGRTVSHTEFSGWLAERRQLLGNPEMPRNAGNRRTDSKQALLEALNQLGATW